MSEVSSNAGSLPASPIRLVREIATGPMSAVFVAERQREHGADLVAVKVMTHRTKGDVERLLRVRDAARDLGALHHRHIVAAEDVARVGELVALISPYVDGIDLLDWIEVLREETVPVPGRVKCELVRAVAVALDAALNMTPRGGETPLGRIHRDIRPTNVMISRDGDLKVVDFGTGFTSLAGRSARQGALKKGLIKYMDPRRREGKRGGPPADIYSLGIMAVELFRGRWLRRLRSHNPAHDRHLAEVVARLPDLGVRGTEDELALRNVLLRMIAYDPEARPDASEVANTFRSLADRARGQSLESFAHDHALPWMEELGGDPDPDLAGVLVDVLSHGDTWDDVPAGSQLPHTLQLKSHRAGPLWEETDEGWRQSEWEVPEELFAPGYGADDETVDTADAPLPAHLDATDPYGVTAEHTVPVVMEPEVEVEVEVEVELELDLDDELEPTESITQPTAPLADQREVEPPTPEADPVAVRQVAPAPDARAPDTPTAPTDRHQVVASWSDTPTPTLTRKTATRTGILLAAAVVVAGMAVAGGLVVGLVLALAP